MAPHDSEWSRHAAAAGPSLQIRERASASRRLAGTDEGAHELAIHLGGDGLGVDPRSGQELARVLHAVDPGRLEVDGLEARLRELGAVLLFLESPRDTADPELGSELTGRTAFLAKPFTPEQLWIKVRALV